jgi:hypothetical protein
MNYKGSGRKLAWPILRQYTGLDGIRISMESLSRYLVFGPRFELGLPEYETGNLSTLQQRSLAILIVV